LDVIESASLSSVSSLHAVEHFGLGRYGDPIDPIGHVRGLEALRRVVAPGGDAYIGLPVGSQRVEFNAHRVLDPELVPSIFSDFDLVEFAAVVKGGLTRELQPGDLRSSTYACGLYHLRRR
jgi:hypothetical protein